MGNKYEELSKHFEENAYETYGACLKQIDITNIRGIEQLKVEIASPITAFCGMNGNGKSTILQMVLCAYRKQDGGKRFYLSNFLRHGQLDKTPFDKNSRLVYKYASERTGQSELFRDIFHKSVTVKRNSKGNGWNGYKRQDSRNIKYLSVSSFLPKVEVGDFTSSFQDTLTIDGEIITSKKVVEAIGKILDISYSDIVKLNTSFRNQTASIGIMKKKGLDYSENHMGFGELRIYHIVSELEKYEENSTVCIDEPEISLHYQAQKKLGEYFVDVVLRKRHQLFIATHSSAILSSLPQESRCLIEKYNGKHTLIPGISPHYAESALSGYKKSPLVIYVEDPIAREVLLEIMRRNKKQNLVKTVTVVHVGDKNAVNTATGAARKAHLKVIAFRDGDVGQGGKGSGLYSLPGSKPPEKEIFSCEAVTKKVREEYGVNWSFSNYDQLNHHKYFSHVAHESGIDESKVIIELTKCYVDEMEDNEIQKVNKIILDALAERR